MRVEEGLDDFPVGMRVLAVDDDPTCLLYLGTLLRRCQYEVTTTNQAVTALEMLRENKDKFDLVISDVHMPDMDGFKLLELVGLEMDLPVIMLSAYGDPKLVMKGITHGACDYLLKPVRIEELKNIWQHVVRKSKNKDNCCLDGRDGLRKGGEEASGTGNLDQAGKLNKKRKDQNEEDEDKDESGHEKEDSSSQKKPRVVWSVDLHRKFVQAVYQLGIDKAVPKKILELMNVEKLTRENVASHLQKYRLYLRRMSRAANHEANLAAVLNSADSPYFQMADINGIRSFRSMAGVASFQNTMLGPHAGNGMLGRLNSSMGLGARGFSSPGTVSLGYVTDQGSGVDNQVKLQHHAKGHDESILHGMPLQPDLVQPNKEMVNNSAPFSVSTDRFSSVMVLEGHPHDTQSGSIICNHFMDQNSRLDAWSNAVKSTMNHVNMGDSASTVPSQNDVRRFDDPPLASLPIEMLNARADMRCQASVSSLNTVPYEWHDQKSEPSYGLNVMRSTLGYTPPANWGSEMLIQDLEQKSTSFQSHMDFDSMREQHGIVDPFAMKHRSTADASINIKDAYLRSGQNVKSRFVLNSAGSLDDVVNAMVKQEQSQVPTLDGDVGSNAYGSLGTLV